MRRAPSPYQNAEIAQPDEGNLPADLGCRTRRKCSKVISTISDHFRPFPTGQLPFFGADANQVQCSRLPSHARGQERKISMSVPVDEIALAQRVLTILVESLLGATAHVRRPPEPATALPEAQPPKSITAFCKSKSISRAFFYALKRKGLAPKLDEIIAPREAGVNRGRGLKLVRITAESERAWDKQMEQMRGSKAAELEVERAREQRVAAAKLAAASPNHISKNGARSVQRRRRRA
jgi:hypothetical protein